MTGLPEEASVAGAFALAVAVTMLATPLARRLAISVSFYDHPLGYKGHLRSTPYLGGAAVMAGFVVASTAFGVTTDYTRVVAFALLLLAVGTLDDRVGLGVALRLAAQLAAATGLWAVNLGWTILPGDTANFILTIFWVVGITNAFNLMDNLDGAAGTVGAVCLAGGGALALTLGDSGLAVLAFAGCGACTGFLPYNLARPSRIFLGDGGSTAVGLIVACTIMAIPDGALDWTLLLASVPLVGLPILDTTLVVISRYRRGAPILSGARDHLTHRLLGVLRSERRVSLALALSQAALCALTLALYQLDPAAVVAASVAYLTVGSAVIAMLLRAPWASAQEESPA